MPSAPDLLKELPDFSLLKRPHRARARTCAPDGYVSEDNAVHKATKPRAKSKQRVLPPKNLLPRRRKHKSKSSKRLKPPSFRRRIVQFGSAFSGKSDVPLSIRYELTRPYVPVVPMDESAKRLKHASKVKDTFLFKAIDEITKSESFMLFYVTEGKLMRHSVTATSAEFENCRRCFRTLEGIGEDASRHAHNGKEDSKVDTDAKAVGESGATEQLQSRENDMETKRETFLGEIVKNANYESLAPIDNVQVKSGSSSDSEDVFRLIYGDHNNELKLHPPSVKAKKKFANLIRFNADKKKRPVAELLKHYSNKMSSFACAKHEEEVCKSPSDLLDDIVNKCVQYKEHVIDLRDDINKRTRELECLASKLKNLDRSKKDLDESILIKRTRSVNEMHEAIGLSMGPTGDVASKLAEIEDRIRMRSVALREHQQLLLSLQKKIEVQKQHATLVNQYSTAFLVIFVGIVVMILYARSI